MTEIKEMWAEPGGAGRGDLRIEAPEGSVAARTAAIPFLDPAKKIPAA